MELEPDDELPLNKAAGPPPIRQQPNSIITRPTMIIRLAGEVLFSIAYLIFANQLASIISAGLPRGE